MPRAEYVRTIRAYRQTLQQLGTQLYVTSLLHDDDAPDLWVHDGEEFAEVEYEDGWMLSSDSFLSDMLEDIAMFLFAVAQPLAGPGSRGSYFAFPKSKDFFVVSLQWPDRWFRNAYRMGRPMFDRFVEILQQNPIFQSTGRKPQRHVKWQVACFLVRFGGHGSATLRCAQQLSVGFGTVILYCKRVIRALRELTHDYISWPSPERREVIMRAIEEICGLPDCIGDGDGSLFEMEEAPHENRRNYFCRKKFPAVNVQATVDHQCRFTSFEMGFPGAMNDVAIFKLSYIWTNRLAHFNGQQYILVDKGYPSTPYTVRPFDELEIGRLSRPEQLRRRTFNKRLSSARIKVEHTFGMLKGRFQALRLLGGIHDVEDVYRVIHALMVLHNMCIDFHDHPEHIPDFNLFQHNSPTPDDLEEVENYGTIIENVIELPLHETEDWLLQAGLQKREDLLDRLVPV